MKQWRLSINSISLIISYNPCIGEKKKTNENKYLLLITKNKQLFRRYLKYLVKKSDQSGSWDGVRVIRIKNLAIQHPGKEHLPMCSKPQQFSLLPLPDSQIRLQFSSHCRISSLCLLLSTPITSILSQTLTAQQSEPLHKDYSKITLWVY